MIAVSIPALLPLWTYFHEKRRARLEGSQLHRDEDVNRKKGDGIINDPRLEELLIETVETQSGTMRSQIPPSANSHTAEQYTSSNPSTATDTQLEKSRDDEDKGKAAVSFKGKVIPDNWD